MEILIIAFLILLNGLFSMSEIAIISARKTTLQSEAKKGDKSSKTALSLAEQPDKFLSTVQIGITLIGILTGMYSGEQLEYDFRDLLISAGMPPVYAGYIAQPVIVIIVTYLSIILGELVPKRIGLNSSNKVAKFVAPLMNFLSKIASPFVWCLAKSTQVMVKVLGLKSSENKMTEEDIKSVIEEGKESGEIEEVEHDIMERLFTLGDRTIDSIMTHRRNIVWLDANMGAGEIIKKVKKSPHQAYIVSEGNLDNILGVVSIKDMFGQIDNPDFSLRKITKHAVSLHDNMEVYKMMELLQQSNTSFGIVYDEYGSLQGVVTYKDVLEALLGSIPGEESNVEIKEREDGKSWLIDGKCSIFKFLEYFDMEDFEVNQEYNTLGGLVLDEMEHIPSEGESVKWNGFNFEIIDMDGPRIDKLLVTKTSQENQDTK